MSEQDVVDNKVLRAPRIKNAALVRERKALIIDTARRLFAQQGYHGTTVREIGEAAGLSQGTLYNYISSKDEVLFLMCEELQLRLQRTIEQAVAGSDSNSSAELIERMVDGLLRVVAERQDEIVLMYQEVHALEPETRRKVLRHGEAFIQYAARALQSTRTGDVSSEVTNASFLAGNILTFMPFMLALRRWSLGRALGPEEQLAGLRRFLLAGLSEWTEAPVPPPQRRPRKPGR